MKRFGRYIILSFFLISFISCKEDDLSFFQQNEPDPPYRLWSLLDDYPALKDFFVGLDQNEFNHKINDFMDTSNDIPGLLPFMMREMAKLLDPNEEPDTDLIGKIAPFITRIVNQDALIKNPQYPYAGMPDDNYEAVCGFFDSIAESDVNGASNMLGIADKAIRYYLITRSEAEVEQGVEDTLLELQGIDPPYTDDDNIIKQMRDGIETICEVMIQPNESMWVDGSGRIAAPGTSGATNTGLGNTVWGIDAMLSGMNDLLAEQQSGGGSEVLLKDILKDLIRASLEIPAAEVNDTSFPEALMDLIFNMETWFTRGDAGDTGSQANKFDGATDYNLIVRNFDALTVAGINVTGTLPHVQAIQPQTVVIKVDGTQVGSDDGTGNIAGSGISSGNIDYDTGVISFTLTTDPGTSPVTADANYSKAYSNAELGNTLKEMFPALVSLFIRSDRNSSVIAEGEDQNEKGIYPLELLAKALSSANINIDGLNFENSMYRMIAEDGQGRNRLDPGSGASKISMLEQLMFLFASLKDIGFYDRFPADDPEGWANHGHGHGDPTGGILTMNDALSNLGTGEMMGFNAYDMALNRDALGQPAGKYLHRSKDSFGKESFSFAPDKPFGDHPFLYDKHYSVLLMMPTALVGDAGSPVGGQPVVNGSPKIPNSANPDGTPLDEDWNAYLAYSESGKGNPNTSTWMMGLMGKIVWRGEGPYFYYDPDVHADGNIYTPGGELYGEMGASGTADTADGLADGFDDKIYNHIWNTDYFLIKSSFIDVNTTLEEVGSFNVVPGSVKVFINKPLPESVNIEIGSDNGSNKISGIGITTGIIDYDTGEITLQVSTDYVPATDTIRVDYQTTQPRTITKEIIPTGAIDVTDEYYAPDNDLVYFIGDHAGEENIQEEDETLDVDIKIDTTLTTPDDGTIKLIEDVDRDGFGKDIVDMPLDGYTVSKFSITIIDDTERNGLGAGTDIVLATDNGLGAIRGFYNYTTSSGTQTINAGTRVYIDGGYGGTARRGWWFNVYSANSNLGSINLGNTDYLNTTNWTNVTKIAGEIIDSNETNFTTSSGTKDIDVGETVFVDPGYTGGGLAYHVYMAEVNLGSVNLGTQDYRITANWKDVTLIRWDGAIDYNRGFISFVLIGNPQGNLWITFTTTNGPVQAQLTPVNRVVNEYISVIFAGSVSIVHDVNKDSDSGLGYGSGNITDDLELGSDDGNNFITGPGIAGTGTIDYSTGNIYLEFSDVPQGDVYAGYYVDGGTYHEFTKLDFIESNDDVEIGTDGDGSTGTVFGSGIVGGSGTIDYATGKLYFELVEVPTGEIYAGYNSTGTPVKVSLQSNISATVDHTLKPPVIVNTIDISNDDAGVVASDNGSGVIVPVSSSVSGTIKYTGKNEAGTLHLDIADLNDLAGETFLKATYEHGNWIRKMTPAETAGAITAYEITSAGAPENVRISFEDRICDSQEEAMYKNLIWLMNEKKMVLVIPMRMDVGKQIVIPVFMVGEFNGLLGVATGGKVLSSYPDSAMFADGNGKWSKSGGYGISYEPGDGRLMVLCNSTANAVLPFLYNCFFGEGSLMPGILGANMGPVKRISFFRDDVDTMCSRDVMDYWEDRNGLVPLFMGLVGELHRYSSVDKNPFRILTEGLIPAITKPMTYYQGDNGVTDPADPAYIPYPRNCWKPRLADMPNPWVKGQTLKNRLAALDPVNDPDPLTPPNFSDRYVVPDSLRIYIDADDSRTFNAGDTLLCDSDSDPDSDGEGQLAGAGILADSSKIVYSTGEITFFLNNAYKNALHIRIDYTWNNDSAGPPNNTGNVAGEDLLKYSERNYLLPASHLPRLPNGNYYLSYDVNGTDNMADAMADYFAPKPNPTLMGIMFESGKDKIIDENGNLVPLDREKRVDGLLPVLCQTDIITKSLKFLQKIGSEKYGNKSEWDSDLTIDENFANWGARKKIFFALEQFMSNVRTELGDAMKIERKDLSGNSYDRNGDGKNDTMIDYPYPSWVVYDKASDIRAEDFTIENLVSDGIYGTDGLANLPEDNPLPADWDEFNELFDHAKELFTDNGVTEGEFNLTENIIDLVDMVFTGVEVTFEQTSALRHTLGAMLTKYEGGSWKYYWDPELSGPADIDVTEILASSDMINIIELFQGRYVDLLDLSAIMMNDEGFLGYLIDNMSSGLPTSQIIDELESLLTANPLINKELPNYDPILWQDFAELMVSAAPLLESEGDSYNDDYYYTKNLADTYVDEDGQFDMYSLLGELLAFGKSEGYLKWFEKTGK